MCLPLENLEKRTLAQGEHTGFAWQIVSNHHGYRCGYVRVGPDHPWFGLSHRDLDAEVHGGLTFAAHGTACATHDDQAEYWLGFDCGHAFDAADPDLMDDETRTYHLETQKRLASLHLGSYMETIKDTAYVENECRSLCKQAYAAKTLKATAAALVSA